MATARNVRTAGWFFFINFAHRVKAHNNICLVYTKFNALSYGYKLSFFWGPIALHGLVHFLNTTGPSLTKVVYVYFDRISYISCCIPIKSQLSLVLWVQMLQKVFSWITGSIVFEFHDISQCIYIYTHNYTYIQDIHILSYYISYYVSQQKSHFISPLINYKSHEIPQLMASKTSRSHTAEPGWPLGFPGSISFRAFSSVAPSLGPTPKSVEVTQFRTASCWNHFTWAYDNDLIVV